VLVIDELDFLMTKDQMILYNLFEWTQKPSTKLVILAIANTMDLPEKMKPKVLSRIGNKRVVYKPYTSKDIQNILKHRLKGLELFESDAINFAAKKLSSYSTDIRKLLMVLKRGVEIMSTKMDNRITIEHIREAFAEATDFPIYKVIAGLGRVTQLVVCCLALHLQKQNC
jgi:origin recognition complex subunit 1